MCWLAICARPVKPLNSRVELQPQQDLWLVAIPSTQATTAHAAACLHLCERAGVAALIWRAFEQEVQKDNLGIALQATRFAHSTVADPCPLCYNCRRGLNSACLPLVA